VSFDGSSSAERSQTFELFTEIKELSSIETFRLFVRGKATGRCEVYAEQRPIELRSYLRIGGNHDRIKSSP